MAERAKTVKIALILVLATALVIILVRQSGALSFTSEKTPVSNTPQQDGGAGESAGGSQGTRPPAILSPKPQWERPGVVGPIPRDPMHIELPKDGGRPQEGLERNAEMAEDSMTAPEFRVAGIVFNTDQPSSIIIDGHILHEGETIHGARVDSITREYAVLSRDRKRWTVRPGQANREPE